MLSRAEQVYNPQSARKQRSVTVPLQIDHDKNSRCLHSNTARRSAELWLWKHYRGCSIKYLLHRNITLMITTQWTILWVTKMSGTKCLRNIATECLVIIIIIVDRQNVHFPTHCSGLFGPVRRRVCSFLADLIRKMSTVSGDDPDSTFLFQRISVLIQWHNSILLRHSRSDGGQEDNQVCLRSCNLYGYRVVALL